MFGRHLAISMRPTLQLRLGQQLAMTPQLRQAIRLLQLSIQELRQEVQQILESNVMLLPDDGAGDEGEATESLDDLPEFETAPNERDDYDFDQESPAEDWAESTSDSWQASDWNPLENLADGGDSLQEQLLWQIRMSRFSNEERAVAEAIVDALNDDGYLTEPLEELCEAAGVDNETGERVLHRIQAMDPPGVGARDLAECLTAQLRLMPPSDARDAAMSLVRLGLEKLARADRVRLAAEIGRPEALVAEALDLIRGLNPRPGNAVESKATEYVVPEVLLVRRGGRWQAELNSTVIPRVRLNEEYARLLRQADTRSPQMQAQLQEARWLIRSLGVRNDTLLRVAQAVVERQQAFFDDGEEAMSPLALRDIAEIVEVHESTISRVTTNKYIHTPRGTFPLKYFFSTEIPARDGGLSSVAVRARIRRLIDEENPQRPLSDQQIAAMLTSEGVRVARRTVAKYREAMRIPASYDRKHAVHRRHTSSS